MSDSLLKKDFKEADIQRMRNIITKKYDSNTKIQTGYSKGNKVHVEGDEWEENGKMWTIKDGIKQSISKLKLAKELNKFPLICPSCSKFMNKFYDKKFYNIHTKCMDCVIKYETQLRLDGKYEEYAQNMINNNVLSHLDEIKDEFQDYLNSDESYITEDGVIETWVGSNNKDRILSEVNQYIENLKSQLK